MLAIGADKAIRINTISKCSKVVAKSIAKYLENKNPKTNDGLTPFHIAAEEGHLEIVKFLAHHLEDKNPTDNQKWTPLHLAAQEGHLDIVKLMFTLAAKAHDLLLNESVSQTTT